MDDVIGRSFAYMLLLFGFFLLAPLFLFLNMDMASRNYVNTAVNKFVENAREEGIIRKSDYRILADELADTGDAYTVRLEHKSRIIAQDDTGYVTTYKSNSLNDVFAVLDGYGEDGVPGTPDDEEKRDYQMKQGDYLAVSVISHSDTIGSRFLGLISGRASGTRMTASAGGIVGNTVR